MRIRVPLIAVMAVVLIAAMSLNAPSVAQDASEDCIQCKHVDCIKGSIKRKKAMAAGYDRIAEKYARAWLDARTGKSADVVDLRARYANDKARADAYLQIKEQYKSYGEDEEAVSLAAGAPEGCPSSDSVGVDGQGASAGTNVETCEITGLPEVMRDAPCKQIADLLVGHESMHQQSCEVRKRTTVSLVDPLTGAKVRDMPAVVLTPSGKAREEAKAYRTEVQALEKLLKEAEKKCKTSFKGVKTSCVIRSPGVKVTMGQEISGKACGDPVSANWTINTVSYVIAPGVGTQRNTDPPWDSDCVAKGSEEERRREAIYKGGPGKGWMCVYDAGDKTRRPSVTIRSFRLPQCNPAGEETITVTVERGECDEDTPPQPPRPRPRPTPSTDPVS